MAFRTAGALRQLSAAVSSASRTSTLPAAAPIARALSTSSGLWNQSTSSSVTLDHLQNQTDVLARSSADASPNTTSAKDEEQFVIPDCLLPTEKHAPTHGVHVATLHMRSYADGVGNLDLFADFARKAAYAIGIPVSGVAHLPTRTSLWTVPRSPFVHKKSQENFWRKTHSRSIKVFDANDQVVDRWLHFLRIHALPGVGQKADLFRYHELGVGDKLMDEAKALQRSGSSDTSTTKSEAREESKQGAATAEGSSADNIKKIADGIVEQEMAREKAEEQK